MMNRDVMGRQMFANGGVARPRITDPYILETLQKLEVAMGEGNAAVATYVQENFRDLQDIAAVHPQVAPIINRGIAILQSQTAPSLRQPGKSLSDLMTPAPDGSMDYYATGPFGYEDAPEAQEAPEGFTERDMEMFRKDYDRYRENEQGEQRLVPQPPPGVIEEMPSPAPYVPMAMGGVATPRDPYVDPGKRTRVLPAQDFRDPYLDPGKRTQVLPNMSTMLLNNFRQEFKREPQDISELRAYAENLGSGAQARMALGGEPMAAAMGQMGGDPMAGMMGGDPMAAMAMGAPMPADLGPAGAEGIASQMDPNVVAVMQGMSRNFGDPEQAGSLEEMMDMVRGDTASEEERRTELAEVVGPEDAQQTPDSVLALVQPLMLLMQAEGATETDTGGIGPMAQEAMNVPVSGDMAGGIMQLAAAPPAPEGGVPPVNFNRGGEVRRFRKAGVVPFNVPNAPTLSTFGSKPSASLIASSSSTVPSQIPSLVSGGASALNTTLADELKARQDIYNKLLGTDEKQLEDDRQMEFYRGLAKAGAAFAQPPDPGQSVFSKLSESLASADIIGGQAKLRAQEAAGKQARNLAALSAAEKALTSEKEFVFKSKLASQTAASDAAQSFRDIQLKFKNDMKLTTTKADRDALLEKVKAQFQNYNAAQQDSRQYLTGVELKNLDNKISKDFALFKDTIGDANREDEKANRLEEMGLKHTFDVFGMQAQTVENLKKMREEQKFDEKTQKAAFAQQNTLEAARAKTQTALQDKRLEAQSIQNEIANAQADKKIALQERATKVNEQLALIKEQAAKLDALGKEVFLYKDPAAALPALLNAKVQVQGQDMTKIQAFAQGKLDELQDNRVKSMIAEVYRGKSIYNPSTGDTVIQQTGYLSPEIEQAVLNRARTRGDIDNYIVATINTRKEADFYKTASPEMKRKRLTDAMNDGTSLSVLERYKAGERQSPKEKAAIGDAIYSAIGTEGFLGQAANYLSAPAAGYTFSKEVASGGSIAQALSNSALRSFLDMTPGRDNVQIQERFAKLIPGVKNPFTNATMYRNQVDALVANLRSERDAAAEKITSGMVTKPADIAEMTKGLRLATALINDYTYISNYIKLKQAD
jgi:hypothetical protein